MQSGERERAGSGKLRNKDKRATGGEDDEHVGVWVVVETLVVAGQWMAKK